MSKDRRGTHARNPVKEKDTSLLSFLPKDKRKPFTIIACVVIVALIVLGVLFSKGILSFTGRYYFDGKKVHAEEGTLTVDMSENKSGKYYSAGHFAGTDKYELDSEYKVLTSDPKAEFKYSGEKADPIFFMRVYGVVGDIKADFDAVLQSSYTGEGEERTLNGETGEKVNANGLTYYWFVGRSFEMPYLDLYIYYGIQYTDYYALQGYAFVDSGEGGYTVVVLNAKGDTENDLPGTEAMLERIGEFADLIYAEKPDDVETSEITVEAAEEGGESAVVGYYAGTDKYALDEDYSLYGVKQSGWKYDGKQGDPIYFMYITGVKGKVSDVLSNVKASYTVTDEEGNVTLNYTEREGVTANGIKYYFVCTGSQPLQNVGLYSNYGISYIDSYTKYSYTYVETCDDRCAMIAVYGKADTENALPDDEALFERAMEFADLITKP